MTVVIWQNYHLVSNFQLSSTRTLTFNRTQVIIIHCPILISPITCKISLTASNHHSRRHSDTQNILLQPTPRRGEERFKYARSAVTACIHHLYNIQRSVEKRPTILHGTRALMHTLATDNDFLRVHSRERKWLHVRCASWHPSRFLSDNVAFKTVY